MRLIQPLKFRTLKTGCFKMPHLHTPRLQTVIFQTGITVASGQCHNIGSQNVSQDTSWISLLLLGYVLTYN